MSQAVRAPMDEVHFCLGHATTPSSADVSNGVAVSPMPMKGAGGSLTACISANGEAMRADHERSMPDCSSIDRSICCCCSLCGHNNSLVRWFSFRCKVPCECTSCKESKEVMGMWLCRGYISTWCPSCGDSLAGSGKRRFYGPGEAGGVPGSPCPPRIGTQMTQ